MRLTSKGIPKPGGQTVDFVIITALEEERDAVLAKLGRMTKLDKEPTDAHTYYRGRVKSTRRDGTTYDVVVTCLLSMGPTDAALRGAMIVKRWNPMYVLLVEIACGVRGEVDHGDILIATQVADYTLGKQEKGRRKVRWNVSPCGSSLLDTAINLSAKWQRRIAHPRPGAGQPRPRRGVVASGGDVVADDRIIAAYSDNWPKLIGIEMEAGGVAAALHQTIERPEFLMIKGVSDFGSDKHEPAVLPWRDYACHAAAAFARAIIESGPSSKIEGVEVQEDDQEERKAAERRWTYLQTCRLRGVEVFILLKESVSESWLRRILESTRISFSRDGASYALGNVFDTSPAPNTKEHSPLFDEAVCAYYERYEADPKYWVRRISPNSPKLSVVAGFYAAVPWAELGQSSVVSLGDLGRLSDVGMGLPPECFKAGVEEFALKFEGDQFSFDFKLSDHGLGLLHEMASVHFQLATTDATVPLSLGTHLSGLHLLEHFHEQLLPSRRERKPEAESIFAGLGGPDGKAISFYPAMPLGFPKTAEADEYTFKISVEDTDSAKLRIEALEAATGEGSADAQAYGELAARYMQAGRMPDAIRCLETAIYAVSPNAELYGLLAEALASLGRYEEALKRLLEAEAFAPEHAALQSAIGGCLGELQRNNEALLHFEAAARLDPSKAHHHTNLGRALAIQERYAEAAEAYERAVGISPDDGASLCLLAVLYAELGRNDEAEERLTAATRLKPNDPDTHEHLGRFLATREQHDRAIAALQRAIEIEESGARYYFLGGVFGAGERWSEAESAFRRALSLTPEHPGLRRNLAVVVLKQGRIDEAVELLETELQLEPDNVEVLQLVGQLRELVSADGSLD
jgi:tetratricopeptide (TPR) repeat protein/nucleoside phosphorylase